MYPSLLLSLFFPADKNDEKVDQNYHESLLSLIKIFFSQMMPTFKNTENSNCKIFSKKSEKPIFMLGQLNLYNICNLQRYVLEFNVFFVYQCIYSIEHLFKIKNSVQIINNYIIKII